MFSRQTNDWELGEVEGLLRRLQGHTVSGGCYNLTVGERGKLFSQILLSSLAGCYP